MVLKRRLEELLQSLLAPIRERRTRFAADPHEALAILDEGTATARGIAGGVLADVRHLFRLDVPPGSR